MKRLLFLITCIGILIYSYSHYRGSSSPSQIEENGDSTDEMEIVSEVEEKTFESKSNKKKLKRLKNPMSALKNFPRGPKKYEPVKEDIPPEEEKKVISDEKGNIYPTALGVTEHFITAYGDLIVGRARDLEDVRDGKKILSVPPPKVWPKGKIPVQVVESIKSSAQMNVIKEVIAKINQSTGINFFLTESSDYKAKVFISRGSSHCYAQVGYTGDITHMSLSEKCSATAIYHEFFHILGFFHEQNRFDRDEYIQILWENIEEEYESQFHLFPEESFPTPYKYGGVFNFTFDSIMIYDSDFFSTNGDYTMVKVDGSSFKSLFLRPSPVDIQRVKELYKDELAEN